MKDVIRREWLWDGGAGEVCKMEDFQVVDRGVWQLIFTLPRFALVILNIITIIIIIIIIIIVVVLRVVYVY
jgi:hypothetical protein